MRHISNIVTSAVFSDQVPQNIILAALTFPCYKSFRLQSYKYTFSWWRPVPNSVDSRNLNHGTASYKQKSTSNHCISDSTIHLIISFIRKNISFWVSPEVSALTLLACSATGIEKWQLNKTPVSPAVAVLIGQQFDANSENNWQTAER